MKRATPMFARAVHPGGILKDELEELGITPIAFAREIAVPLIRVNPNTQLFIRPLVLRQMLGSLDLQSDQVVFCLALTEEIFPPEKRDTAHMKCPSLCLN